MDTDNCIVRRGGIRTEEGKRARMVSNASCVRYSLVGTKAGEVRRNYKEKKTTRRGQQRLPVVGGKGGKESKKH